MASADLNFAVVAEEEVKELVESQAAFADAVETFGYAAESTFSAQTLRNGSGLSLGLGESKCF